MLIIGFGVAWRARRLNATLLRAAALGLLGLPIMLAIVALLGMWIYARFTLFALPGAILLMAIGANACWLRSRNLGIAAIIIMIGAAAGDLITRPARQPLREAAQFIIESDPQAPVLVIGLRHGVFNAYKGELQVTHSLHHGADLETALRRAQPQWIVMLYPRHVPSDNLALLETQGFTITRRLPGWIDQGGGEIIIFRRSIPALR